MEPKPEVLQDSITLTRENAASLLEDAKLLFGLDRYSTALALAVLAQEEFAKAFLLQLVADGALPLNREVRRSMERHDCKHLIGLVMEWLPSWEDLDASEIGKARAKWHEEYIAWLNRKIARHKKGDFSTYHNDPEPIEPVVPPPADVADALNIYRHEKIERLRGGFPWTDPDWAKGRARRIAKGSLDREKQTALYVTITKSGAVGRTPKDITEKQAAKAIELAEHLGDLPLFSDEYDSLRRIMKMIFEEIQRDVSQ